MVANKSNIIQLSDRGIEVNSENAKDLVSYIADVVSLNAKEIPVNRSTDRLSYKPEDETSIRGVNNVLTPSSIVINN